LSHVDLAFTEPEFKARLAAVRKAMDEADVDVAILDEIESMTWVSGFGISETLWRACVVPSTDEPFLIVRSLDIVPARERSWLPHIVGFKDWDDPVGVLAEELARRQLDQANIGIEFQSQSMSIARFQQLQSSLPGARFMDLGGRLRALRTIKSEAEVAYLRRAAEICDAALINAVKAVRVGGTQRDVVKAAGMTYLEMGGDTGPVGPITSGVGWGALHGNEHTRPIERDAIVHIELTPRVRGYSARIMRSVTVGVPTPRQLEVMQALIEAQDAQLKAIVPGAKARDIDALVREPVMRRGLRPSFENITGYTLGCFPGTTQKVSDLSHAFTPLADWTIVAGMTLHMYVSAEGLAVSETIVVREAGIERLTLSARKLFSVPA
jgi:Xaa-Pro aminopeptidase